MGYAVFAARKIMLTNSINMLNLQLTDIMNKKMDLTELGSAVSDGDISAMDIAQCQQAGLACEYGLDLFGTKFSKYGDGEYYVGLANAEKEARQNFGTSTAANVGKGAVAGGVIGALAGIISGPIGWAALAGAAIGGAVFGIGGKLFNKTQASDEYIKEYKEQYEAKKQEEIARDLQEQIAKMENELDKRQKTLETKIQAYQADLQSTEKAEANGIQNSVPKYAGVQ